MTIFKNKKALLCIMLTFIIFVSLLSCFAFTTKAATVTVGAFQVTGGTNGTDYSYSSSTLTIKTATALTIKNTNPSSATTNKIVVNSGVSANITLAGVNINVSSITDAVAFRIADNSTGNVKITLAAGTSNILKSGKNKPGLEKSGTYSSTLGTLTIAGPGSLTATGGQFGAGIGSRKANGCANIVINGGTIVATGGAQGPGIGSAWNDNGLSTVVAKNITIKNAKVTAVAGTTSSLGGAGIGGGSCSRGEGITIENSTIIATGSSGGAGIGGGGTAKGLNIKITNSVVTATGNSHSTLRGGSGIGSGCGVESENITISNSSVKAVAGTNAKPIGGGNAKPAVIPTNGTENVYPLTLANPNDEDVYINGTKYPFKNHRAASSSDTTLYAYVPLPDAPYTELEVKIGDTVKYYVFNGTQFVLYELDLVVSGQNVICGTDYACSSGVLTIKSNKAITIQNRYPGTSTTHRIEVATGVSANITLMV